MTEAEGKYGEERRNVQRVVITGATSMIGIALIKECIKNHVEVMAIVRKGTGKLGYLPRSVYIEVLECDQGQFASVRNDSGKLYDVFYHFAWAYTAKEKRDDPILQEENIRYTLDAVELAARLGCKKFIGAGSQAEYGPKSCVITSDTKINPQLSYGTAKYAAGMLSRKLCEKHGMVHIWGRIFSVYGNNDNDGTMLSYAIDRFIRGKVARFSSGTQMWDYLHEDDAGTIFYLIGERTDQDAVYCIASGESRPLKEFILEMRDTFGAGATCEFDSDTGRPGEGLRADAEELFRDISYRPVVTFKEGIKKMITYRTEQMKNEN